MPLGFLVIYVVSLFTKAPSTEMQAFVDEIRKPRGRTVLEEKILTGAHGQIAGGALRGPASFRLAFAALAGRTAAVMVRQCREH